MTERTCISFALSSKLPCSNSIDTDCSFCPSHLLQTRRAYDEYKSAAQVYFEEYVVAEELDTLNTVDVLRRLHIKATRAGELRAQFTLKHVHPAHRDAGHQHQVDLYKQFAKLYEKQLAHHYDVDMLNSKIKKAQLDAHRTKLEKLEHRERTLSTSREQLTTTWQQLNSVQLARTKRRQQADEARAVDRELNETGHKNMLLLAKRLVWTRMSVSQDHWRSSSLFEPFMNVWHRFITINMENNVIQHLPRETQVYGCVEMFLVWLFGRTLEDYSEQFVLGAVFLHDTSDEEFISGWHEHSASDSSAPLSNIEMFASVVLGYYLIGFANEQDRVRLLRRLEAVRQRRDAGFCFSTLLKNDSSAPALAIWTQKFINKHLVKLAHIEKFQNQVIAEGGRQ